MEEIPRPEKSRWPGLVKSLGVMVVGVAVKEPIMVWAGYIYGTLKVGQILNRRALNPSSSSGLPIAEHTDLQSPPNLPLADESDISRMMAEAERLVQKPDSE